MFSIQHVPPLHRRIIAEFRNSRVGASLVNPVPCPRLWVTPILDGPYETRPAVRTGWGIDEGFQIGGPIRSAAHVEILVDGCAGGSDIGTHIADPLSIIVDQNVAVALGIDVVLVHSARIVEDLLDFGV